MWLEICHPNDVLKNGWKRVVEIHDIREVNDHLSSPDFELYEGILARRGDFVSVYRNGQWINISANSVFMNVGIFVHEKDRSLLDVWFSPLFVSRFIKICSYFIATPVMIQIALDYLTMIGGRSGVSIKRAIKLIKKWLSGNRSNSLLKELDQCSVRLFRVGDDASRNIADSELFYAYAHLCDACIPQSGINRLGDVFSSGVMARANISAPTSELFEFIRSRVSFYDIVMAL